MPSPPPEPNVTTLLQARYQNSSNAITVRAPTKTMHQFERSNELRLDELKIESTTYLIHDYIPPAQQGPAFTMGTCYLSLFSRIWSLPPCSNLYMSMWTSFTVVIGHMPYLAWRITALWCAHYYIFYGTIIRCRYWGCAMLYITAHDTLMCLLLHFSTVSSILS